MSGLREHWSSRIGFILAAGGSAIGLGTLWMLPYMIGQNGGGAFILVFLLFTLFIGIPLFVAELLLGRQGQRGLVGCFAKFSHGDSTWRAAGWLGVACTYLVAGWYAVIAGWGFNYLVMSVTEAFKGRSIDQVGSLFNAFRSAGDVNVLWQAVFLLSVAAILYHGIAKGIERWSKLLTSGLFVMLVALAAYSSTLSGFGEAVNYVLYPDFSQLTASGTLKALTLALFTLSLGEGIMVTYGSYLSPKDDIPKTAIIVAVAILFISVLVSLMIFPMVFTFEFPPQAGEGLIFRTLPFVFEQLPGSAFLAILFFVLLIFAAVTSAIGQLEVMVANHIDLHGWSRKKAVFVTTVITFIIGLPTALSESSFAIFPTWHRVFRLSFLETNYVLIDWMLAIFSLCICYFVGYVMPAKVRQEGFESGSSLKNLYLVWLFLIRLLVPVAIIAVMLNRAGLFI